MVVQINKFGDILMSRPAGKDAFLMAKAYILNSINPSEEITLDFSKVKVLTPSWVDEFVTGIKNNYKNKIEYTNTNNETVTASLKAIIA